ncbi:MAG: DUF1800 domain-containing protein [Candidatus Promineifilaceae bacterium]
MSQRSVTLNRRQLFRAALGSLPLDQTLSVEPNVVLPPISTIALNRMGFGPSAGDVEAFDALGADDVSRLQAYIEQQLNPDAIDDSACDARITEAAFPTLNKSRTALWTDYKAVKGKAQSVPLKDMRRLKLLRAVHSKRQLVEVLAEFWHDHFSVDGSTKPVRSMITAYDRDVIRPNILGNFRTFLEANTKSTCMLYYLDNVSNKKKGPNENYARELCELHTLGEKAYLGPTEQQDVAGYPDAPIGYVEDDVFAIAKCFTGWSVANRASQGGTLGGFHYFAGRHDTSGKLVMGLTIPANQGEMQDGLDVLDRLAAHPATAHHIAYKLCRRLIHDFPPNDVVESAAAVFIEKSAEADQLKHVVRHILQSNAFSSSWEGKFKRPFEAAVSTLRAIGADPSSYAKSNKHVNGTINHIASGGQPLFDWSPPNGYPDVGAYWQGSTGFVARWRMYNWLVFRLPDVNTVTPAELTTPNEIADFWLARIFGYAISADDRNTIVTFFADGGDPNTPMDRSKNKYITLIRAGVALILSTTQFQQR